MTTCLTKNQIEKHAREIRHEFNRLLERLRLAQKKPEAMQWQFLHHCFRKLMGEENCEFDFGCERDEACRRAKHYKYEVSQWMERHYKKTHDEPISYTFRLEHVSRKSRFIPNDDNDYPSDHLYLLLVLTTSAGNPTLQELHNILYRVVDGAISAEFSLYHKLPEEDLRILDDYFDSGGKAYERIRDTVRKHLRNREVISNDGNPSFKRLSRLKVLQTDGERALVETREKWVLKWWSLDKEEYAPQIYEVANRQSYSLIKRDGRWLVSENEYERPRRSRL